MTTPPPAPASAAQGLLPCPFCGGNATLDSDRDAAWVECDDCGISRSANFGDKEEKAIAAWNTRAARPAPRVDVERLRALAAKWDERAKALYAQFQANDTTIYRRYLLRGKHDATKECATELEFALASADGAVTQGWRPIETAPAADGGDGQQYILVCGGIARGVERVLADGGWWRYRIKTNGKAPFTHWQPLPAPPAALERTDGN